ncbi:hypothetical protein CXG50_20610 [Pseudomonas plecoglossicida]|nr:hypothetical protein CSW00_23590 [Pseudomonas sp. MR 02]PLP90662.1 hypothetical protein CX682_13840 [Pseudomonas sp. FFUP_PS_41]PLU99729.1 hypothetical protein CXG52_05705 [Pseudomonas plecoglossicida]PLV05781.1 hypothetical protein CXG50_20610 [Pseudomonas plecoglossicida]TXI06495.1 MAG: hypothetical protein E6Q70_08075 [Pseudomonas monteilii]
MLQSRAIFCRSGLVSRKGCAAAPDLQLRREDCRGRFAALSRHKAAPTGKRAGLQVSARQTR